MDDQDAIQKAMFGGDESPSEPTNETPSAAGISTMLSGGDDTLYVADEKSGKVNGPAVTAGVLVVAAIGGLWFLNSRAGGPAEAAAEETMAAAQIDGFLTGQRASIEEMRQVLADTEAIQQQFLKYPTASQIPLGALKTDPFDFDPPEQRKMPTAQDPEVLAKLEAERTAARQETLRLALADVKVKSVMDVGGEPACMIGHRLYRVGDDLAVSGETFRVLGIRSDLIVVASDDVRFGLSVGR
jgi:hypothetical protein